MTMTFRQWWLSFALAILTMGGAATATKADLLDEIRERGEIRVGVALFQPWAMRDERGRLIGFEIDVAKQLSHDMDVRLRHEVMDFDALLPALREGGIDIIASGLSITPWRALEVAFSQPYAHSGITLVGNLARAGLYDRMEDFDRPEVRIGVRRDTTAEGVAESAFPQAERVIFENEAEVSAALLLGRVDAVVAASPWPELETLRYPDRFFLPFDYPLVVTGEAFAVRRGEESFLTFLNAWINFRTLDGWLDDTRGFWFHTLEWEEALPLTQRSGRAYTTGGALVE